MHSPAMRAANRPPQTRSPSSRAARPAAAASTRQGRGVARPPRQRVTVETFREDRLYPAITRAVAEILATGKVVAPVDVLVRTGLLSPERLEDWYRGRVPYLEMVIEGNLTKLARLLRVLRMHAHELNLVPSETIYIRRTSGPSTRLRFTETGDPPVEAAYARHFVWPGKGPFHPPRPKEET